MAHVLTRVMSVAVRSRRPPAALLAHLRGAVERLDPDATVFRGRTMAQVLDPAAALQSE